AFHDCVREPPGWYGLHHPLDGGRAPVTHPPDRPGAVSRLIARVLVAARAPRPPLVVAVGIGDKLPDGLGRCLGEAFRLDMHLGHAIFLCTRWNMYRMVPSAMPASQARDRLLAAAVRHAMDSGIADLSLRQLAAAIGTSHRMLLYHFGSREGLLIAVTRAVEEQHRTALLASAPTVP